jgi:hypothetical protein
MTSYKIATDAAIAVMESFWNATLPGLNGLPFKFTDDDIVDFYSLSDALEQTPNMTLDSLIKNQYEEEPPDQIKAAFAVFIATFRQVKTALAVAQHNAAVAEMNAVVQKNALAAH